MIPIKIETLLEGQSPFCRWVYSKKEAGKEQDCTMEKFAAWKVRARRYRNPKIGEFFKEIDLSEKKSMGISKILRELKRNGSPLPEFGMDANCNGN